MYSYLPQTIFIYLRTFYVIRTFVTALSWCFGRSSIRTLSVRPLSPLERSTLFCKLFQLGRLSYRVWKGQAFENVVRIMFTHHSFDVHSLCLYQSTKSKCGSLTVNEQLGSNIVYVICCEGEATASGRLTR